MLLTNDEIVRCHLSQDPSYSRREAAKEDVFHAIRDCPFAKRIWNKFLPHDFMPWFYTSDGLGSTCSDVVVGDCSLQDVPMADDIHRRVQELDIVHRMNSLLSHKPDRRDVLIGWSAPPFGWLKLNSDGAVKRNRNSFAGGVIHNYEGRWIKGTQNLIRKDWSVQIHHVYREANGVADSLASLVGTFLLVSMSSPMCPTKSETLCSRTL
ncbi:conserved hypothetical protein [Ricinus communis]|uniref:RNase H type-1 domain-containing protein n=1 Tax=Ricinus communis TaxID=3988 RepID=B9T3Y4_RICCO|nr:conserved hypothetical protein [Ricinus communis]